MKERPILFSGPMVRAILGGRKTQTRRIVKTGTPDDWNACPYGVIGDHLWVRECFSKPYELDIQAKCFTGFYRATDAGRKVKWMPSIFMPRWASRIALEITNVRIERLQDISEADAQREGWDWSNHDVMQTYDPVTMDTARRWFQAKWDEINGKRAPWGSNPLVWLVEFKRMEN